MKKIYYEFKKRKRVKLFYFLKNSLKSVKNLRELNFKVNL